MIATLLLALAAAPAADNGHLDLFKAVADKVPEADQRAIYGMLGLKQGKDGALVVTGCEESPASFTVEVKDLNGDGLPEVLVTGGNTCTSGNAGTSVWLFVRLAKGRPFTTQLGFPGSAEILASKNRGFPDLKIGGPGLCFPVWRWNGATYRHHKDVADPQSPGACRRK